MTGVPTSNIKLSVEFIAIEITKIGPSRAPRRSFVAFVTNTLLFFFTRFQWPTINPVSPNALLCIMHHIAEHIVISAVHMES